MLATPLSFLLEMIISYGCVHSILARRSNKSIQAILTATKCASSTDIDRKITLATECFTASNKSSELILRDRTRLSEANALTISEYVLSMKREINPSPNTIRTTIQFLYELSKSLRNIEKRFEDMTRNDVLLYLDSYRKSDSEDPLHKWIGSYNTKLIILMRFFKWLYYPDIDTPKRRNELSAQERKPECIMGIPKLKRKETSCYKPSDLWTQEDDILFLKWVTNKRDRCYHTMARDLSARPHEILNLKIKDIVFKTVDGGKQYAEVLVNGKTGSRHIPLIQSIPYIKDWLSNHPSRNNPNAPLFVSFDKHSMGRKQLAVSAIEQIYRYYQKEFFPKLLSTQGSAIIPNEDKEKIKNLLTKPFVPYIRRHSALTEKSLKLKSHTLNQHAGWSPRSQMHLKYLHYFGNESSESLLEAYGIVTNNNIPIDTLNPKICPNCNEGNTQDAKFCSKCKMIMSFEGYQEALESQSKKEDELKVMKEQFNAMQSQIQALIAAIGNTKDQNQVNTMASTLYKSGILSIPNCKSDGTAKQ
jgi:integrase/recombinase XerD